MSESKPPPKLDPRKLTFEQETELLHNLPASAWAKAVEEHEAEENERGQRLGWKPQADQTPFWAKYGHRSETEYYNAMLQAIEDNLNRNVMAEHENDLASLPPEVRASRTPEQWLATPPLEILKLARDAKAKGEE